MTDLPFFITDLLNKKRNYLQELDLDYNLYILAKGINKLDIVTKLLQKYGSPYKSRSTWWQWEHEVRIPNTMARNAVRRWANHIYSLDIPMHKLSLSEIEQCGRPFIIEYELENKAEPTMIIVLGGDTEEVKIYKRSGETPSFPNAPVTTVTRRKSRSARKQVKRYGFTIESAKTANLFKAERTKHEMTTDQFVYHLLLVHGMEFELDQEHQ